jgi:hypothetical protein
MSQFRFQSSDGSDIAAQEWLRVWAELYPEKDYDHAEYSELIAKHKTLVRDDFVRIGKWKDGARTESKWKPNVASVAYRIWMQAASEMPKCPEGRGVADFLDDWSNRKYTDDRATGPVEKRFGLSRATTLLHFLSGGCFPIFDSRVRRAMTRLLSPNSARVENTVRWYRDSYCSLFAVLAALCGAEDFRTMDKALFSYGARNLPFSKRKKAR